MQQRPLFRIEDEETSAVNHAEDPSIRCCHHVGIESRPGQDRFAPLYLTGRNMEHTKLRAWVGVSALQGAAGGFPDNSCSASPIASRRSLMKAGSVPTAYTSANSSGTASSLW